MIDIGRLPVFRKFLRSKPQRNFLVVLWDEASRNLERYYVVEQRQFITEPFDIGAWEEARVFGGMNFPDELVSYADAIRDFNSALKEVKEFEESYSSSIENKTHENAELLHGKKEALEAKFQHLRPVIFSAHKVLREMLARRRVS